MGKICFRYAKVVIMRVLSMPKNYCSALFIKMNNSKSPKLSNASSSKQIGNQATSFSPFFLNRRKSRQACADPSSWNFIWTKQDLGKVVPKVKSLGKIMCQSKRAVHFLTPNLMESTEQEKLVSPSQLQQQPQTSFVKTQHIFQSKPNIISPVLSISNIWDVFVSKCSFSLENYFHLSNN